MNVNNNAHGINQFMIVRQCSFDLERTDLEAKE